MIYQIIKGFLRLSNKDDIVNKGIELLSLSLSRDVICYLNVDKHNKSKLYKKILIIRIKMIWIVKMKKLLQVGFYPFNSGRK